MNKSLDAKTIETLYATALRIRMTEDAIAREYPKAEMKTPIHLYTGEEAIASGVCSALTKDDIVYAYYRSHGWYLAKGGNMNRMMGELFGKASGCSGGYGGSGVVSPITCGPKFGSRSGGFRSTPPLAAAASVPRISNLPAPISKVPPPSAPSCPSRT